MRKENNKNNEKKLKKRKRLKIKMTNKKYIK